MFSSPFYRTSLEYWQTSTLNYTWYWIFAVFLGFFGLDLLYARAPLGAIAKFIVNIFTLGAWWYYDAIEATFNKKQVQTVGPSFPPYGPLGIAGGQFMGKGTDKEKDKHANFLIYGAIVLFTGLFGGDSFLVGDDLSGYIRIISLLSLIFSPIALIWWGYKLYLYFIRTDQILDQNYEYFGAPKPANAGAICPNVLEMFTAWIIDTAGVVLEYIPILNKFAPALRMLAASLRKAYGIVVDVVDAVQKVSELDMSTLETDREQVKDLHAASLPIKAQVGGSSDSVSDSVSDTAGSSILIIAIGAIIVSSLSMTLWRGYKNWKDVNSNAEADKPSSERSDAPPDPGHIRKAITE